MGGYSWLSLLGWMTCFLVRWMRRRLLAACSRASCCVTCDLARSYEAGERARCSLSGSPSGRFVDCSLIARLSPAARLTRREPDFSGLARRLACWLAAARKFVPVASCLAGWLAVLFAVGVRLAGCLVAARCVAICLAILLVVCPVLPVSLPSLTIKLGPRAEYEIRTQYNQLTDKKLEKIDCDSREYVSVQKNYDLEFSDPMAKYIVFDQPMELGFQREMPLKAQRKDAIFTGMDAAKTTGKFRYNNFYLTHAIENQWRPLSSVTGRLRFVLLIKKPKPWRLWFLSQVTADYSNNTYDGTARQGSPFADAMLEPRGRIHIILESQPSSGVGCLNERLTEKTWNAIAYGHPFLVIGTNHALDLLKAHGFRSFGHCINETYATVIEPWARMRAAIVEIHRINQLSQDDYDDLYRCLEPIAMENRNTLLTVIREKQAQQRLYAWGMVTTPGYDFTAFHHHIDQSFNLTSCRH